MSGRSGAPIHPPVPGSPGLDRARSELRRRRLPLMPDDRRTVAALAVLLAVGIAQLGDLLTFVRMIAVAGIGAELNPLVAHGARTLGIEILVAVKVALIVLVSATFAILARRHVRLAAMVATFGTVVGLLGAFSNVLAIA